MAEVRIEHVNVSVSDPNATAALLCRLFDWHIRWQGAAKNGGHTVHVGTKGTYIALYKSPAPMRENPATDDTKGYLNHIGIEVEDLDAAEERVLATGTRTHSHGDYAPGRRFYFNDADGVEYEIVSYAGAARKAQKL